MDEYYDEDDQYDDDDADWDNYDDVGGQSFAARQPTKALDPTDPPPLPPDLRTFAPTPTPLCISIEHARIVCDAIQAVKSKATSAAAAVKGGKAAAAPAAAGGASAMARALCDPPPPRPNGKQQKGALPTCLDSRFD